MYHKLGIEEVLESLDVNPEVGLSENEARARHAEYGSFSADDKSGKSLFRSILSQLNGPMIYMLLVAAVISALVGGWVDSVAIAAIVVINAVIGVVQDRRATRALDALRRLTVTPALVRRDGKVREIPADELAVGDVVILEAGRIVPADLRLIFSRGLLINEFALTGERAPVLKDFEHVSHGDIPLRDRVNSAYSGTVVKSGRGVGIVTATGMSAVMEQVTDATNESEKAKSPLQANLACLGRRLCLATLALCAAFFIIGILRGEKFVELLLTSVSLAVAVIPEGLIAVMTIVMALGVANMVGKKAVVRNLSAVEKLGCVTVICTDKTGTLTQGSMTVVAAYSDGKMSDDVSSVPVPLIEGFALCNDADITDDVETGNSTEIALLKFAKDCGKDLTGLRERFPRIDELAFDSSRKMMTTLHRSGRETISYTKGAVESILAQSSHIFENGEICALRSSHCEDIIAAAEEMSGRALRVLALGMRAGDYGPREENLIFVGLVGMIDPPREEAKAAVEKCSEAGIRVVMITGDHRATALAVGKAVDIANDESSVLTGAELDDMSDEELSACIDHINIFSRVDPRQKIRIVRALREHGHIVSMTGDGVDDAYSLNEADVGISMGAAGTDAAKDSSDIILTDDNFSTIAVAVEQGRNIFENIRKSVYFLLSSNLGELITMFFAMLFGWKAPLLPLHILWINLITDSLPALALGANPASSDTMQKPPRPAEEGIFTRRGWMSVGIYGAVIGAVALVMFKIAEYVTGSIETARTCAFATLAISQLFHAVGVRIGMRGIFRANHQENKFMLWAVLTGLVLTAAVLYIPLFASLFDTRPLGILWIGGIIVASLIPIAAHEIEVLIMHMKKRREIKNGD